MQYYQAMLKFLATQDVSQEAFEQELSNSGNSPTIFNEHIENLLDTCPKDFYKLWDLDYSIDFDQSAQGEVFWRAVANTLSHIGPTLRDCLTPYMIKVTNEQILVMFLKHNRAYSAYKRSYVKVSSVATWKGIIMLPGWVQLPEGNPYWEKLSSKWRTLCKDLNLRATIDISKALKIR